MIFSYGCTYGIGMWAGWDLQAKSLLLFALGYTAVLYGRRYFREKKIPIDLFFLLLAGAVVVWLLLSAPGKIYLEELLSYLGEWELSGTLELKYGWFIPLLLLALGELFYRRLAGYTAVKLGISAGIFILLIWQACEESPWSVLPAAALLFVALDGIVVSYQRLAEKRKEIRTTEVLPLLLGMVIFVSVLPINTKPVSWDGVIKFWDRTKDAVSEFLAERIYGDEENEFGVGTIGFSDGGSSFWGSLVDGGSREMLKVSVYAGSGRQERYFAGVTKETYEEDSWSARDEAPAAGGLLTGKFNPDFWERLYYLYQANLPGVEKERFCQNDTYSVQYGSLRTKVLFSPANGYDIRPEGKEKVLLSAGGNPVFAEKQSGGSGYEIGGLSMNLENEALVSYLREATTREITEQRSVPVGERKSSVEASKETLFGECLMRMGITMEELPGLTDPAAEDWLRTREQRIRERDLQLPENLSREVKELAVSLTENIGNDYDRVQAIRNYFLKDGGFTYSTVPTELPEGKQVMDYFLFESKEGYCSYYATAVALLSRCIGIPARYVEGVTVNYEEEEDGWYPVAGRDAHAWTQVYLTGFGWLDVDATPGYGGRRVSWKDTSGEVGQIDVGGPPEGMTQGTEGTSEEPGQQGQAKRENGLSYVLVWIAGICGCFLLVVLIGKAVAVFTYKRAGNRKKTELLMRQLLKNLKKQKLGIREDETLRSYKKRLYSDGHMREEELRVFDWYEGVRYGGQKIEPEDIRRLEQLCQKERKQAGKMARNRFRQGPKGRTEKKKT